MLQGSILGTFLVQYLISGFIFLSPKALVLLVIRMTPHRSRVQVTWIGLLNLLDKHQRNFLNGSVII